MIPTHVLLKTHLFLMLEMLRVIHIDPGNTVSIETYVISDHRLGLGALGIEITSVISDIEGWLGNKCKLLLVLLLEKLGGSKR